MNKLSGFSSQKVKLLLSKFYALNFSKASVDSAIALEIIDLAWKEAIEFNNLDNYSELREKIKTLYNLTKNQTATEVIERDPRFVFDFSKDKIFLDFGSNKLDTLNKIVMKYPNIEKAIGVDVIPQASKFKLPEKSIYYQIKDDLSDFDIPYKADSINIQFVLHHLKNEEHIKKVLSKLSSVLKETGRIILWEETFENNIDLEKLIHENLKISINTNEELTGEFYKLTIDERFEFILVNDWLINTFNSHMQWSLQYRSWDEWTNLFKDAGLKVNRKFNLGLRVNGNLKQGVHIIGEFIKY